MSSSLYGLKLNKCRKLNKTRIVFSFKLLENIYSNVSIKLFISQYELIYSLLCEMEIYYLPCSMKQKEEFKKKKNVSVKMDKLVN